MEGVECTLKNSHRTKFVEAWAAFMPNITDDHLYAQETLTRDE